MVSALPVPAQLYAALSKEPMASYPYTAPFPKQMKSDVEKKRKNMGFNPFCRWTQQMYRQTQCKRGGQTREAEINLPSESMPKRTLKV